MKLNELIANVRKRCQEAQLLTDIEIAMIIIPATFTEKDLEVIVNYLESSEI